MRVTEIRKFFSRPEDKASPINGETFFIYGVVGQIAIWTLAMVLAIILESWILWIAVLLYPIPVASLLWIWVKTGDESEDEQSSST